MEEWKIIEDFPNYSISNKGNVLNNKTGNIISQQKQYNGYYSVSMWKDRKKYRKSIHRLVAKAFIPNPNNFPVVNHKDENKENNTVWVNEDGSVDFEKSNLEWCTTIYNVNYGTGIKRRAISQTNRADCSQPIIAYNDDGETVFEFKSLMDAERNGFDRRHIFSVIKGGYKNHPLHHYKGYNWKYKKVDEN